LKISDCDYILTHKPGVGGMMLSRHWDRQLHNNILEGVWEKMDYETPCIESVIETFSSMCGVEPELSGKPEIIPTPKTFRSDDVLGIIGLTGACKGDIMISMKSEIAQKLIGAFIMEEINEINDDLMDGFGEILNIIAGAFAAKVEEKKFQLALPTVMAGQHQTHIREGIRFISIPMVFPDWGEFKAMILMEEA